jgi:hypothetical protein
MKPRLAALIILALGLASSASAQSVADHLRCYKVKDPQAKAAYTADLDGLVAEPGCKIAVPGHLFCTQTTKTNVAPTPPGGADNTGAAGRFLCYKVKCPKATLPAVPWHDQFGMRTLTAATKAASLVCAPEITPLPTCSAARVFCNCTQAGAFCDSVAGLCPSSPTCADARAYCVSTCSVNARPGPSGAMPA